MEAQKTQDAQEAVKEARRAYYREWAKKNPEKVAATRARFWERQAARMQQKKEAAGK